MKNMTWAEYIELIEAIRRASPEALARATAYAEKCIRENAK